MAIREDQILVVGAINTDLVATMKRAPAAGETVIASSFSIHGGGKAANQAVAAARSGAAIALVGATGDDDFGSARRRDLERDGIMVDWVMVDPASSSGVALIFVEHGGENRIAHVLGATASVSASHVIAALESVLPRWLLATNELPPEALGALLPAARAAGTRVVLNATPEPEVVLGFLDDVDVLIVNEVEAGTLLGGATLDDPTDAVGKLRARGVPTVVLTAGRDGAIADDGHGPIRRHPPAVEVVDSTGAGDAFCGALVAELARGEPLDAAVEYAVLASALSVTRAGAQSSIPTRDEVKQFRVTNE